MAYEPVHSIEEARTRLDELHGQIVRANNSLAAILRSEFEAKVAGFMAPPGTPRHEREANANFGAQTYTAEAFEARRDLRNLEEERDHLRFLVAHRLIG